MSYNLYNLVIFLFFKMASRTCSPPDITCSEFAFFVNDNEERDGVENRKQPE